MDCVGNKVCVIGAGISGLTATKCLLETGFDVICFDANDNVGGRWCKHNSNSIMRSTVTNLPSSFSCFSDFPVPDKFAMYMSANQMEEFIKLYATRFNLLSHIQLSVQVVRVEPIEDAANTKWRVSCERTKTGNRFESICDFVVVCVGFNNTPYIPVPMKSALKDFDGQIVHSFDYTGAAEFEHKNILICGFGNSGADIACDLSQRANSLYLSTSHGGYVLPRILKGCMPAIEGIRTRISQYSPDFLKNACFRSVIKKANATYDHDILGLAPTLGSNILVNDDICMRILSGQVVLKPGICSSSGKDVHLNNGTKLRNIDAVILCTGYFRHFPFFSDDVIAITEDQKSIRLYKNIFPSKWNSLAFVGICNSAGPTSIESEMQSRYAAHVFTGAIKLPDVITMECEIDCSFEKTRRGCKGNVKSYNRTVAVFPYFDDLARDIGCKISIPRLLFTDPKLAWCLLFKWSCHEYRLVGPNSWEGAREAILRESEKTFAFLERQ